MIKKKIVVLTGAGISAESGISTFRDSGGLWEGHNIEDVATLKGWIKNPGMVLEFYNQRRKQASSVKPNGGHLELKKLEEKYDVVIITQNIDLLHEMAGSENVIHIHGELFKSRSTVDPSLVYDIETDELNLGDTCELGSQLRPHIVWFGEDVPLLETAIKEVESADIFIIVGTSLVVYPAAGLRDFVSKKVPVYVIDPRIPDIEKKNNYIFIQEKGSIGLQKVVSELMG